MRYRVLRFFQKSRSMSCDMKMTEENIRIVSYMHHDSKPELGVK